MHRTRSTGDRGVILPLAAATMFLLLGLSAFATDLGWFYVNAGRIQRAADAAALAGVIHMPARFDLATLSAAELAGANGYQNGIDNAAVTVSTVTDQPHQLEVTITDTVETYFLKVFGRTTQTIARTARAEFIPPLPLGSPDSRFGNDPVDGVQDNLWANIHGKHTDTIMGDAFSSACFDGVGSGNPSCLQNPSWRETGYIYGVEVAAGTPSATVQILDGAFHNELGANRNADNIRTGDHNEFCTRPGCTGPTTSFILYAPDPTPLDLSDNTQLCRRDYNPQPQVAAGAPYAWDTLCTLNSPVAGVYPLQVVVDANQGADDRNDGANRYSLRVTPSGNRLYGLGDISIFNNFSGSNTQFFLAEVSSVYRGKTLVVELYDPGDAQFRVTNQIHILGPDGTDWLSCAVSWRDEVTETWSSMGNSSPCVIDATRPTFDYNGDWLKFEMKLPDNYSCGSCWWKIRYEYRGTAADTTTWRAYVLGNPVHLVPLS